MAAPTLYHLVISHDEALPENERMFTQEPGEIWVPNSTDAINLILRRGYSPASLVWDSHVRRNGSKVAVTKDIEAIWQRHVASSYTLLDYKIPFYCAFVGGNTTDHVTPAMIQDWLQDRWKEHAFSKEILL